MKRYKTYVATVLACLLSASCTTRIADTTVISTKNINLENTEGFTTAYNARVKGQDKKHIVICIPFGTPNVKEAIDRAIEKGGSNCVGLANAALEYNWFYIPYVYGQTGYTVEGDPIYKKK